VSTISLSVCNLALHQGHDFGFLHQIAILDRNFRGSNIPRGGPHEPLVAFLQLFYWVGLHDAIL